MVRVSVPARADATVSSARPRHRFGRSPRLAVDGSPVVRSYLRFRVPAHSGMLVRAVLVVRSSGALHGRTRLLTTSTRWRESTVSYATAPRPRALVRSRGRLAADRSLRFRVFGPVHGAGQYAFVLATRSPVRSAFASRETGARGPRLVLTYDTSAWSPSYPVRAAFYYPWFPETWGPPKRRFTHYHPSLGWYRSSSPALIASHIDSMLYARLHVGIASWWGPGSSTDGRVSALLAGATGKPFRWALYYEAEGYGDPSPATIGDQLSYVASHYAGSPAYLRVGGKPVIFVYADPNDRCDMARRWHTANAGRFLVVLKDFPGYTSCPDQPDDWHQYAPANATQTSTGSFSVSPGFWHADEATPRLVRRPHTFAADVAAMAASRKRWQLVTTWNEWGEGTAVESAREWATPDGEGAYVDILRRVLKGR